MLKLTTAAKPILLALIVVTASCGRSIFPEPEPEIDFSGPPDIDLSEFEITFEDEFDSLDVSGQRCDSRWIAHTPYNGDFGAAAFADPSRDFPFITGDGILRIEARKEPDFGWQAGLLSSWNTCDDGFAQQYGYFEISTQLPASEGFWPAFWLLGINREEFAAEVDVFEYHTNRPHILELTVHIHAPADEDPYKNGHVQRIKPGMLSEQYNTYGVDVQEDEMVFYLNRKEIWRTPTLPRFRQPLYVLLNLAMDGGEITENTPKSEYMYVDYVRVYARK